MSFFLFLEHNKGHFEEWWKPRHRLKQTRKSVATGFQHLLKKETQQVNGGLMMIEFLYLSELSL